MKETNCKVCNDVLIVAPKAQGKMFCGVKCRNKFHNARIKPGAYVKKEKKSDIAIPLSMRWQAWSENQKLVHAALCSPQMGVM